MSNQENILDDFVERKPLPRQQYYLMQLTVCFVVVWGIAYLHWLEVVDVMPILEKPLVWGGLCTIVLSIIYTIKQVLKFNLGSAIFITVLLFILGVFVGIVLIEFLNLDNRKLPFYRELLRLSIISTVLGLMPVLLTEIYYRRLEKIKNKK